MLTELTELNSISGCFMLGCRERSGAVVSTSSHVQLDTTLCIIMRYSARKVDNQLLAIVSRASADIDDMAILDLQQ